MRARRWAAGVAALSLAAGCAHVPPRVEVPDLPISHPAWRAALAEQTASPVVGGNAVEVLLDGPEIFPAMLAAIESARRSITYEQFVYKEAPISLALVRALAERCRAGVSVHVLLDGWGVRWFPAAYRERLLAAGCEFAVFRPLSLRTLGVANHRNHRRILVVDGRVAFTGGSGVGDQWLGDGDVARRWRETDVRFEGPVVHQAQRAFAAHWREATGRTLAGEAYYPELPAAGAVLAQVVTSSPAAGDRSLHALHAAAIRAARRAIAITNQYLLLDDRLAGALVGAARRGVDVDVVAPAMPTNRLVYAAGHARLDRLLLGGVRVWGYQASPLHAKTMVVDGVWATVGSTNLDPRALEINEELNLVVHDAGVAARLEAAFADDLARSRPVTYEAWRRRELWVRLLGILTVPIRSQL